MNPINAMVDQIDPMPLALGPAVKPPAPKPAAAKLDLRDYWDCATDRDLQPLAKEIFVDLARPGSDVTVVTPYAKAVHDAINKKAEELREQISGVLDVYRGKAAPRFDETKAAVLNAASRFGKERVREVLRQYTGAGIEARLLNIAPTAYRSLIADLKALG